MHTTRSAIDSSSWSPRVSDDQRNVVSISGKRGIRTPGGLAPSTVFKTVAIVRSATFPPDTLVPIFRPAPEAARPQCQAVASSADRNAVMARSISSSFTTSGGMKRMTLP